MGGGAAANTNLLPSPTAATPAPARAQAPHATAEGADGAVPMDVCDAEGGSSVVNAASRRTCTRTGLGPVETTEDEWCVLGKDWLRGIRPTIAAAYVRGFKALQNATGQARKALSQPSARASLNLSDIS